MISPNNLHVDGLEQERRNSIANELELRLSCSNPSMCTIIRTKFSWEYPQTTIMFFSIMSSSILHDDNLKHSLCNFHDEHFKGHLYSCHCFDATDTRATMMLEHHWQHSKREPQVIIVSCLHSSLYWQPSLPFLTVCGWLNIWLIYWQSLWQPLSNQSQVPFTVHNSLFSWYRAICQVLPALSHNGTNASMALVPFWHSTGWCNCHWFNSGMMLASANRISLLLTIVIGIVLILAQYRLMQLISVWFWVSDGWCNWHWFDSGSALSDGIGIGFILGQHWLMHLVSVLFWLNVAHCS